jgi:co-chaperonin GroES (HSP10)
MKPHFERNIDVELDRLTPLSDFVLVKRIVEEYADPDKLIVLPAAASKPEHGLRRGIVVRVGRGDLLPEGERWSMTVSPGDEVIYPRVPANDLRINGEEYTMLHEEQAVLAIVERDAA